MKTIEIKKYTLVDAGNYNVGIGIHDKTEIAIISKSTGKICMFYYIKRGRKLAKVKRKFKQWLNSGEYFTFSFAYPFHSIFYLVSFASGKGRWYASIFLRTIQGSHYRPR